MNNDISIIRDYFAKLGLSTEIADIYLALHASGAQTISELSRSSSIERTRIYRLLDELKEAALIEVASSYKRGLIKAAPLSNLRILVSKREQEVQSLHDELTLIEAAVSRSQMASPATRVQFYKGAEGAKQMFWNETKATTEVLSILYENIQIKTDSRFFERWVAACNAAGLTFKSIYGDAFKDSMDNWYSTHSNERLAQWEGRHISSAVYPVSHGTLIYNDVVAYFNWQADEIYGIELYNKDIADSQRALFAMLWQQSTP